MLLNTERARAEVTANGQEERVTELVFAPSAETAFASPEELGRSPDSTASARRLVELTPAARTSTPGPRNLRHAVTQIVLVTSRARVREEDRDRSEVTLADRESVVAWVIRPSSGATRR